MKTIWIGVILVFCSLFAKALPAQVVDASVCDILANPVSFDGKIVRIKGTVVAGFDEFIIQGPGCNQLVNAIWLSYPEGTKGKAGPAAFVQLQLGRNNPASVPSVNRTAVNLDKNKDFKEFDSLLSASAKASGMCLGCVRNKVAATLVGRLDGMKDAGVVSDSAGKFLSANGFGNMNRYNARLVLQSVSDVSPQEIDYSKDAALSGSPIEGTTRPVAPTADQFKKAAAAFGGPGEDNGVYMGFGVANEVPKKDNAKGAHDSPDGLLINCTIDSERLKGDAESRAISHLGTHIADIRSDRADIASESAFLSELRAWQVTILGVILNHQKILTLPGSYWVWNSDRAEADRGKLADQTILRYLTDWVGLSDTVKQ
jgi:hypothetical protein